MLGTAHRVESKHEFGIFRFASEDSIVAQTTLPTQPLNLPQGAAFWIGSLFAGALLVVFVVVLFQRGDPSPGKHSVLRLLAAIFAGLCATFMTGAALIEAKQTSSYGTLTISGAAGIALFIFVYLLFGKPHASPVVNPTISFTVGSGWKFQHVVKELVKLDKAGGFAVFQNLTDAELNAPLEQKQLQVPSIEAGLAQLRYLASEKIRKYDVERAGHEYRIIGRT